MRYLKQSTAATELIGPFLDKDDGKTEETGLATTATEISKAGGAFAAGPALGTHDSDGWYPISLTTTHTNTIGPLIVKVHDVATHLPVWEVFHVLSANVYDSIFGAATDKLQVDLVEMVGVAQSATDLKDFADDGYDPSTNKLTGLLLADAVTTVNGLANNVITANSIATNAFASAKFASDYFTSAAAAIWNALTSGLTTVGSIGKLIVDNLNAAIDSRAPASTAVSNADYTSARAAKLDNLDATVSSRLASVSYTAPDNAGIAANGTAISALSTLVTARTLLAASYGTAANQSTILTNIAALDALIVAIKAVSDKLNTTMELDVAVYRFTANALEQAPAGGGGGSSDDGVSVMG